MKTKILGIIIVAALVLLGIYFFTAGSPAVVSEEVQNQVETQLAPGSDDAVQVDTRTPEELLAEEGSLPVEEEVTTEETSEEVMIKDPAAEQSEEELVGGDAVPTEQVSGEASFTVLGSNFAYDITEMEVKRGDTVTVTFRSTDGFHDWVVDEFSAATEKVSTGNETTVTFVADQAGEFEYYCSVGSHRAQGMIGTLIVTE